MTGFTSEEEGEAALGCPGELPRAGAVPLSLTRVRKMRSSLSYQEPPIAQLARQASTTKVQSSRRCVLPPTWAVSTSQKYDPPSTRSVCRVTERLFHVDPPGELNAKSVPDAGKSSTPLQMIRTEHQDPPLHADSAVKVATKTKV